jgi:hypothetical protein
MATQSSDQVEEEAADLQFPKGNYQVLKIVTYYESVYLFHAVLCAIFVHIYIM